MVGADGCQTQQEKQPQGGTRILFASRLSKSDQTLLVLPCACPLGETFRADLLLQKVGDIPEYGNGLYNHSQTLIKGLGFRVLTVKEVLRSS